MANDQLGGRGSAVACESPLVRPYSHDWKPCRQAARRPDAQARQSAMPRWADLPGRTAVPDLRLAVSGSFTGLAPRLTGQSGDFR